MNLKVSILIIIFCFFSSNQAMHFFPKKAGFITYQKEFDDKLEQYQDGSVAPLKTFASFLALAGPIELARHLLPYDSSLGIACRCFVAGPDIALLGAFIYFLTPYFNALSTKELLALKKQCLDKGFHKHKVDFEAIGCELYNKNSFVFSNKIKWQRNFCCKQDSDTLDPQCTQVYQEIERFYNLAAIGAISFIPKDPSESVYDARCVRPFPGLASIANSEIPKIYGTKVGLPIQFCLPKDILPEKRRRFENLFYDRQLEVKLTQEEKRK